MMFIREDASLSNKSNDEFLSLNFKKSKSIHPDCLIHVLGGINQIKDPYCRHREICAFP